MELIFEVIRDAGGGFTTTCLNDHIGVNRAASLRELHDNITDAVDARFSGRAKPGADAIHLMMFND